MIEKPGEKALKTMEELKNTVAVFKIPTTPKKPREKFKILSEESYIEEMGKIIQRDFFPDLEKLKAQNQYLDAIEKNDVIKLRELYAKYSGKRPSQREGSESPATFETPISKPNSTPRSFTGRPTTPTSSKCSNLGAKAPSDIHNLDSYLQTYTSEDNHSFNEIIEAADKKLRQKFAILYEAETLQAIEMSHSLALPSIEQQFEPIAPGSRNLDMWTYRNKNYIMYVPDGVDLTKEEKLEMAKLRMEVVHSNTRLKSNPFDESHSQEAISEAAKSHAKIQSGRVDVDGNIVETSITPHIRGFGFVKTPSPCPGVADTPLMTWGEIEGTPFRLDGSDTPIRPSTGPSFRITETSRRENIALELAEKAGERMRGQKAKAMEAARRNIQSPYTRSSIERLATMSPAAKRLASAKFGLRDSMLTPSPQWSTKHTPVHRTTPSPLVRKKTPQLLQKKNATETKGDYLTDDLLKIPNKRPRASDFF